MAVFEGLGGGFHVTEPVAGDCGGVFAAAALVFFARTAGARGIAGDELGLFFQIGVSGGHGLQLGFAFLFNLPVEEGFHVSEGHGGGFGGRFG